MFDTQNPDINLHLVLNINRLRPKTISLRKILHMKPKEKEELLQKERKLKLESQIKKVQVKKEIAIKNQRYEVAADLRDEEKELVEKLRSL